MAQGKLNDYFSKYDWPNSKNYEGEWKDNKMNGHGIMILSDGTKYEGDYVNDKKHGNGTITWRNNFIL